MEQHSETDKYKIVISAIERAARKYKIKDVDDFQCYACDRMIYNNQIFKSPALLTFVANNLAKNYIRQEINREKAFMKEATQSSYFLNEYLPDNLSIDKKILFNMIFVLGMSRTECSKALRENWRTTIRRYDSLIEILRTANANIF
jgi:hypothetical protein